jgi:hypothetical protein
MGKSIKGTEAGYPSNFQRASHSSPETLHKPQIDRSQPAKWGKTFRVTLQTNNVREGSMGKVIFGVSDSSRSRNPAIKQEWPKNNHGREKRNMIFAIEKVNNI